MVGAKPFGHHAIQTRDEAGALLWVECACRGWVGFPRPGMAHTVWAAFDVHRAYAREVAASRLGTAGPRTGGVDSSGPANLEAVS